MDDIPALLDQISTMQNVYGSYLHIPQQATPVLLPSLSDTDRNYTSEQLPSQRSGHTMAHSHDRGHEDIAGVQNTAWRSHEYGSVVDVLQSVPTQMYQPQSGSLRSPAPGTKRAREPDRAYDTFIAAPNVFNDQRQLDHDHADTPEISSAATSSHYFSSPVRSEIRPRKRQNRDPGITAATIFTQPRPQTDNRTVKTMHDTHHAPTIRSVPLVSAQCLPEPLRSIFPFAYFNAIQSACYEAISTTDENFLLSAPTGSGKTVIFELAIVRLLRAEPKLSSKIVYLAPTRALCSERQQDWNAKFSSLGLTVVEMTGDTDSKSLRSVQQAEVIVTTPEKWDTMTRKWKDNEALVRLIKLLLIDEVHILGKDRGSTLEAVVSRMKSIGSAIRFVAVSATVPNARDVATWLGRSTDQLDRAAILEEFGEDFRPVPLSKHVLGYHMQGNAFQLDSNLNRRLPEVIKRFSIQKPILIFCFTRKSCMQTAKKLVEWHKTLAPQERCWAAPKGHLRVQDEQLRPIAAAGVAWHHAGLSGADRSTIEAAYMKGDISVICCTSTLAVGINLPCHLVIVKGTSTLEGPGLLSEVSDFDLLQMIGRAGRPQFDKEAVAIVMTRNEKVAHFDKLTKCTEVIESRLHLNLIEHVNAEIGLGTIFDLESAMRWLASTFLFVRLKANPTHYRSEDDPIRCTLNDSLEIICKRALQLLIDQDLVKPGEFLQHTSMGAAMARYYVSFETMKDLARLESAPKVSDILSTLCNAQELHEVHFRQNERSLFQNVNQHVSTKYPFKTNVTLVQQKVSLLVQAILGGLETLREDANYRQQYHLDQKMVLQHIRRLIRCVVDIEVSRCDGIGARNALMLVRSFGARVWDDSPLSMQQLEGIGPVSTRKLVNSNFRSIDDILDSPAARLETVLGRGAPFGSELLRKARAFPKLQISLDPCEDRATKGEGFVGIRIKVKISLVNDLPPPNYRHICVCLLVARSDGRILEFIRISAAKVMTGMEKIIKTHFTKADQYITAYVSCEEIAGTQKIATFRPTIPTCMFDDVESADIDVIPSPSVFGSKTGGLDAETDDAPTTAHVKGADQLYFEIDHVGDDDLVAATKTTASSASCQNTRTLKHKTATIRQRKESERSRDGEKEKTKDGVILQPERLANGNWKCHHTCKEREGCKHHCCKEGMRTKPKPSRSKTVNQTKDADSAKRDSIKEYGSKPVQFQKPGDDESLEIMDLTQDFEDSNTRFDPVSAISTNDGPGRWRKPPQTYASNNISGHASRRLEQPDDIPDEVSVYGDTSLDSLEMLDLISHSGRRTPAPRPHIAHSSDNSIPHRSLFVTPPPGTVQELHDDSDEEFLDAALVGAADSFALSMEGQSVRRTRLLSSDKGEPGTLPQQWHEGDLTPRDSPQIDGSEADRKAVGILGGWETGSDLLDNGTGADEGDTATQRAELQAFLHTHFGDLVELI